MFTPLRKCIPCFVCVLQGVKVSLLLLYLVTIDASAIWLKTVSVAYSLQHFCKSCLFKFKISRGLGEVLVVGLCPLCVSLSLASR